MKDERYSFSSTQSGTGNCGNSLSHFLDKHFVKTTSFLKFWIGILSHIFLTKIS